LIILRSGCGSSGRLFSFDCFAIIGAFCRWVKFA
jgi:hypothetical protein